MHAHPRHVGQRFLDLLLALTALLISGVSLIVAVEHGRTERALVEANAQLVQANSWPFLQADAVYGRTAPVTVKLVNSGIGPAKLETLEVLFDGKPVDDIGSLLTLCCDLPTDEDARNRVAPGGIRTHDLQQEVLRPGESDVFIEVPGTADAHTLTLRYASSRRRISFRACYCSVFDKCWESSLVGLRPQAVGSCPAVVHPFNGNDQ